MEQVLRQTYAFFFRDYHLTRRYFSWVVVFTFYAVVNSATVVLIGVAAGVPNIGLGIGGAWISLGAASLCNYWLMSRRDPPRWSPPAHRSDPPANTAP